MPEGLTVVRGLLVVGPFAGADSRTLDREVWYGEFLHLHDFAFLGAHWPKGSHAENFKAVRNALEQFAADSKHPGLVHAPYVGKRFSAGDGFASRCWSRIPARSSSVRG